MKKQRPINATDLTNPQQFEDLFTRHLNPAPLNNIQAQLGDVNQHLTLANTNLIQLRGQLHNQNLALNQFTNVSKAHYKKQDKLTKNTHDMIYFIQRDAVTANANRTQEHQEMISRIGNLNNMNFTSQLIPDNSGSVSASSIVDQPMTPRPSLFNRATGGLGNPGRVFRDLVSPPSGRVRPAGIGQSAGDRRRRSAGSGTEGNTTNAGSG